jgi:hypothetical protein
MQWGRIKTNEENLATLEWAHAYRGSKTALPGRLSVAELARTHDDDLRRYCALAGLSRRKTAPVSLVRQAFRQVFRVRVALEKSIRYSADEALARNEDDFDVLLQSGFYGASKKQGVSIRMPLSSCTPTRLCAGACYAHDSHDAMPAPVVRGVVNGIIAERFEYGDKRTRQAILARLQPQTQRAIRAALQEVRVLGPGWTRRPYIRFSHVGEITAFPHFANALAGQVYQLSSGEVDGVVYTRHPRARDLDPELLVINFTLDKSSQTRKSWAPPQARLVFSAFGGELSSEADVNFLEHHRWIHALPVGTGRVCPTTLPETRVRTCDAVRCDRCFKPPKQPDGAGSQALEAMVQATAHGTKGEDIKRPHKPDPLGEVVRLQAEDADPVLHPTA